MNKTQKLKTVILTDKSYTEYMRKLTGNLNDNDYIFKGNIQGPSYYPNKFKRLKEKLHLDPDYFLYTFRHTVGTKIYQETKDIKYVANQLGDKEDTVLRHYVNIGLDQFKQYIK
jgi:integrase